MKKQHQIHLAETKTDLKTYLQHHQNLSARKIKTLLKQKKIKLNGKVAYWDTKLKNGDILTIDLSEQINTDIIPQDIPLNILHEDDYFIALSKPPHMLVHPTPNHQKDTLANALQHYFQTQNLQVPIRFLNRIDMDTSGIIIAPKSSESHGAFSRMMEETTVEKYYIAITEGHLTPLDGTIDKPIDKDPENPIKRTVLPTGQHAVTRYQVEKHLENASVVRLQILTGRTHQIRVHLSSIGHPIIGDTLYGQGSRHIDRQALHAAKMVFNHPITKQPMTIEAPLPEDIRQLIAKLT